jgi:hypothetical protein
LEATTLWQKSLRQHPVGL